MAPICVANRKRVREWNASNAARLTVRDAAFAAAAGRLCRLAAERADLRMMRMTPFAVAVVLRCRPPKASHRWRLPQMPTVGGLMHLRGIAAS